MIANAAQNNRSPVPERPVLPGRCLGRRTAVRLFQGMIDHPSVRQPFTYRLRHRLHPCLPGPAGELVAGGQGVGVLGTQDSLLDGQQGGEQVAGADRIPPLTRGAEG